MNNNFLLRWLIHKDNRLFTWLTNGAIGILFLIFFISLGLTVAIYFRPFYYMGMERISAETGAPVEMIKENYDALIDWCSPFYEGELDFPSLPESASGVSHFEEVKVIFNIFFVMLFVTPLFLASSFFARIMPLRFLGLPLTATGLYASSAWRAHSTEA